MKKEDIAYIAGLFDGEGSIIIARSLGPQRIKKKQSPSYHLYISITNTDKDVLKWLYKIHGGQFLKVWRKKPQKNRKTCWDWRLSCNQAKSFLELLLPYLKIKKIQAEIAINYQMFSSTRKKGGHKRLTVSDLEKKEHYKKELEKSRTPEIRPNEKPGF